MADTPWTEGPWYGVKSADDEWFIKDDFGGRHIAFIGTKRAWQDTGPYFDANASLIAAAPDMAEAWAMGGDLETPDFLDFVADRLILHGDSPNADFILSLRQRAAAGRAALAKARGEQ